jgi:hypothetical protein
VSDAAARPKKTKKKNPRPAAPGVGRDSLVKCKYGGVRAISTAIARAASFLFIS